MNEETKQKMTGVAHDVAAGVQATAEKNAATATGWKKVAWILAAIGAAVVGYFTGGASQNQPDVSEPPAEVTSTDCE